MNKTALTAYEVAADAYHTARRASSAAARVALAAKRGSDLDAALAEFDRLFAITRAARIAKRAAWARVVA